MILVLKGIYLMLVDQTIMPSENQYQDNNKISPSTDITTTPLASSPSSDLDPPAADTAAAAVKRYEHQQARLKDHSEKRDQLRQGFQDIYQIHKDTITTTKSTVRTEKIG